jgi:hypothetical protein
MLGPNRDLPRIRRQTGPSTPEGKPGPAPADNISLLRPHAALPRPEDRERIDAFCRILLGGSAVPQADETYGAAPRSVKSVRHDAPHPQQVHQVASGLRPQDPVDLGIM